MAMTTRTTRTTRTSGRHSFSATRKPLPPRLKWPILAGCGHVVFYGRPVPEVESPVYCRRCRTFSYRIDDSDG
jgi:hypothetical protein